MSTAAKKRAALFELPALPQASLWMTNESMYRLTQGGNCKGAVPVHGKASATAKLPLFTAEQMIAYGKRCAAIAKATGSAA